MLDSFGIEGVNQTIENLYRINGVVAKPAVAVGMRKGMKVIQKSIRSLIKEPSVKVTVSSRFKRSRGNTRIFAKVGGSVGKRMNSQHSRSKSQVHPEGGKGISKYNAHWWFMGTRIRPHPIFGNSGRMWTHKSNMNPVLRGYLRSKGAATSTMRKEIKRAFNKRLWQRIRTKGLTIRAHKVGGGFGIK